MGVDELGQGLGKDARDGNTERAPHPRNQAALLPEDRIPRHGQLHLDGQDLGISATLHKGLIP